MDQVQCVAGHMWSGGTPGPRRRRWRRRGAAPDACAPPRPSLPSPCQPGPVHLWRWWSGVGVQWIKCNAWRGTCGGWHPGPSAAAGRRRGAAPDACAPPRPSLPSPCQPGPVHLWRWWSGWGVQWIKCNAWRGTCGGWHPGPRRRRGGAAAPRPTRVPRRGPRCRAHASPGVCTSGGGGVGWGCNGSSAMRGGAHVVGGTPGPRRRRRRRRGRRVCPAAGLAAEPMPARVCAPLAVDGVGEGCNGSSAMRGGAHVVGGTPGPRRRRGGAAAPLPTRVPAAGLAAEPMPARVCAPLFFFWGGGGGGALHVCPCGDRVTPGEY